MRISPPLFISKYPLQAYATHGPAVSAAGCKRTRSQTAASRGPALDPFRAVFSQDGSDPKPAPAGYLRARPRDALPIAMLRSGHVWPLDDDPSEPPPASPDCPHCVVCVSRDGQAPHPQELPWLHVCHVLLRCAAPSQGPRALALLAFHHDLTELYDYLHCDDEAGLSLDAPTLGDGPSETWDEAVSALLPQLEACIADEAFSPSDELALQRRLLAIVLNPSDWAALPAAHSAGSVESAARFLRGEPHPHARSLWPEEFGTLAESDLWEVCDSVRVRISQLEACPAPCGPGADCSRAAGVGGGSVGRPSGRARHCASAERGGSISEDEVQLNVNCESAVPPRCGVRRPMLDPG